MDYFEWEDLPEEECARFWAQEPEGIRHLFANIANMNSDPRYACASLVAEVLLAFRLHGLGFRWVEYAVEEMVGIIERAKAKEYGYE